MRSNRSGRALALAMVLALWGTGVHAQGVTWTVDGRTSLAWWQVSPYRHLLWGTTCPEDPSWRPGEGASQSASKDPFQRAANDTGYARHVNRRAGSPCGEGVGGAIVTSDTTGWQGVRGTIVLKANALVTGLDMRDAYARKTVLETARYPEIRFTIDSLVQVQSSESIRALAVGTFELRGVREPMTVPIRASRCATGIRIRAAFEIRVRDLIRRYGVSGDVLSLAVQSGMWKAIEVGVNVVLTPAATAIVATH